MRQYAKMGLLWLAAKTVLRHPFDKQSYKQVYFDTVRKVEPMLVKEYKPVMKESADQVRNKAPKEHRRSKNIQFCWLQGLENTREVVKAIGRCSVYPALVMMLAMFLIEQVYSHFHHKELMWRILRRRGRRDRIKGCLTVFMSGYYFRME